MNSQNSKAIALIPARSGSKRILQKNILKINDHPIIAYTISAAIESGIFKTVFVSTDSEQYAEIARYYGAEVPFLRPAKFAEDLSPDIEWVRYSIDELLIMGRIFDYFSILRPTSPLRTASSIKRANDEFLIATHADSLRAVELCKQHPAKMWKIVNNKLDPLMQRSDGGVDWFSSPTQSLPEIWVQNASMEFAHMRCLSEFNSITGRVIAPFKTVFPEGFDINRPEDVVALQSLVDTSPNLLPVVKQPPF